MQTNKQLFFITLLFLQFNTFSELYGPSVKKVIGKVLRVKGSVALHQNQNILMQYASKNTPITNDIFIKTRENAKIIIKFKRGELLTLGQNSKVYISFANRYGRVSVKLLKGKLLVQDYGLGKKNIVASTKNSKYAYSGEYLALSSNQGKEKVYTSKGNKVYKYSLTGKEKTSFQEADLNKLIEKKIHSKRKLYVATEKTPKAKEKIEPQTEIKTETENNIEDEINELFGENEVKSDAENDIENEINSLFGNDDSNKKTKKQVFFDDDNQEFKLDLDFLIKSTAYLQSPKEEHDIDDTPLALESRLGLGNKTIIGGQSSLTTAGWIEIGTRKKTYESFDNLHDSRKEKRGYLTLNEAYYQLSQESSDLTIGKKVYRTGKGLIYSPSDRITPKDTLIPSDPLYLGNYLINYDIYVDKFDFSFVILPFFKANRTPPPYNRWTVIPSGANYNLTSEYPSGLAWKNIQSFFKVETTWSGWDLALGVYNGPNPDPVIRNDVDNSSGSPEFTLVKEYVPVTNLSFGFSTTFKKLEIHGEILKQNASEGRDDSYTTYMIGGFYTIDEWCKIIGIDKITAIIEFTNENIHKNQTYPYYITSSATSRLFQRSIIGSTNIQLSEKLSLGYDFHSDSKKKGEVKVYSVNYSFHNSGKLKFKLEQFSGTGKSVYATWDNNDNLSLEYRYNF